MYHKELDKIKSDLIKSICNYLYDHGHTITYVGKPWSSVHADWIYFNTVLDVDYLVSQFDHDKRLNVHQNLDPKSGLEQGLIDESTGEGVMGLLE